MLEHLGGMQDASAIFMSTKPIEKLVVWQLGNELREKVHSISDTQGVSCDGKFRDQLRDAAASVTRNIAEGFGRYKHKEFARFLTIARGSLLELQDCLHDGVVRRHWTGVAVRDLDALCNRTIAATTSLIRFLRTHPDPPEDSF